MKGEERGSFWKKPPFLWKVLLSLGLGFVGSGFFLFQREVSFWNFLGELFLMTLAGGLFLGYPLVLTGYQGFLLYRAFRGESSRKSRVGYDLWTLFLAFSYEFLYLSLERNVVFTSSWNEQLYNAQHHGPIFPGSFLSVGILALLFLVALLLLRVKSVKDLPPLVAVFSLSSLYLGTIFVGVWTFHILQIGERITDMVLLLPAGVTVIIVGKTVFYVIGEFSLEGRRGRIDGIPILGKIYGVLGNPRSWPFLAIFFMVPLLGIFVMVLSLFGQAPDALIKAFTETGDWNFSEKIPPPNLYYDEHYLCTVAVRGHKRLVKPLRRGIRHGHEVVVNRQLLIANAFEEVLEERTPRFHREVRGFYDRYGFPLARCIRSPWGADLMWILMKPLEWLFLTVLYFSDAHPEDRIALQYTGKSFKDWRKVVG